MITCGWRNCYHSNNECMYVARFPCRSCKITAANLVRLLYDSCMQDCVLFISCMAPRLARNLARVDLQDYCKIIARSCKIVATSLAICKIFEQVYKTLLQDVSDFDASQPASFLQEPYVWELRSNGRRLMMDPPTLRRKDR